MGPDPGMGARVSGVMQVMAAGRTCVAIMRAGQLRDIHTMAQGNGDAQLKIRVVFASGLVLGPGKVDLLEGVRETGSISAAGRRMKMSYKRAWDLIDAMNQHFHVPVVQTSKGGSGGGGATLTAQGEAVVAHYRQLQARCRVAAGEDVTTLAAAMRPPPA